ncbi:MAG: hypothetical protein DCC67_13940, partial [Planctomycetota bacterium]
AVVEQLADRYGGHAAMGGVALQLAGDGYGVLPGLEWGMDDQTVYRFERAAGLTLDVGDLDNHRRRANKLLGPHLAAWSEWRRTQVTKFYADIAQGLTARQARFRLFLCTEDVLAGAEAGQRLRQAVAGRASLEAAFDEIGLDVRQLAASPGISLLRPRRLGAVESVELAAADERINLAPELDEALAPNAQCGELLYHSAARLRLPSFDQQSPFGAEKTHLVLSSPFVPMGPDGRRWLVSALACRDFDMVAAGADTLLLASNEGLAEAVRILKELPPPSAAVRTERRAPTTLRVYRAHGGTTVCALNESPWPVELTLPLEMKAETAWRQLGAKSEASAERGVLAAGASAWSLSLPPYGIAARRLDSTDVEIGAAAPQIAESARADLVQRIADIEQRMQNLDALRPYNYLQNPQFELTGENGRVLGWLPRIGSLGAVEMHEGEANVPGGAGRAIHLRSEDATGVAIQSHLFAVPATGQLVVRALVRAAEAQPGARLYGWVEYQLAGAWRQRFVALGEGGSIGDQWTECEFSIDDLPIASGGQMRIQFHLVGAGQAWIDDVRLYDLRFPKSQREALAKRLYAAKTALEENQLLECRRLVDGYWPRRIIEHVPPTGLASRAAEPPSAPVGDRQSKGFNERLRTMVPRILR